MDINDEKMHPVVDEPAWSESYYFNFVDPDSKLAMFTRMGFRPGNKWADGLHVVYLGGDRVAFTYGRRTIAEDLTAYNNDLSAGSLTINCKEPFKHWQIKYDGDAQDIADAAILLTRRKERPEGWFKPARLSMTVDFYAITEPHYAASGTRGHFEQSGRVSGKIGLDGEYWTVNGFGVRDKSWGPRDWGAGIRESSTSSDSTKRVTDPAPFINWVSMNFGTEVAMGASCFRDSNGVMRGSGWYQRDAKTQSLNNVVIESQYRNDSIWHTAIQMTAETEAGKSILVEGKILTICPTKIAMPNGATFVNEGLAEFKMEGLTGYGISEHWHSVFKP